MIYDINKSTSYGCIEKVTKNNRVDISDKLGEILTPISDFIYHQIDYATHFVKLFYSGFRSVQSSEHRNINELLFACFHKNLLTLHSCTMLTEQGLYGTSRPLLRNAYEWLIIAKFCNVSENTKVLERWADQESVYFSNSVLKKIVTPDNTIFKEFWTMLSQMTHSTKSSMQTILEVNLEDNLLHVQSNLALIGALLECNYHLLNSHIYNEELAYYVKKYPPPSNNRKSIPNLRKECKKCKKAIRQVMGSSSIELVTSYEKTWEIKG